MALPKHLQTSVGKTKANEQEDKLYKHILSGALDYKGDFSTKDTLIESKATEKNSFRITNDVLDKLSEEAAQMGKENRVLIIEIAEKYRLICKVEGM